MEWSSSFEGLNINDIQSQDELGVLLNRDTQVQSRELENIYNTPALVEVTKTTKEKHVFIIKYKNQTLQMTVNTLYFRLRDETYSVNLK